jgi:hypothetical protein
MTRLGLLACLCGLSWALAADDALTGAVFGLGASVMTLVLLHSPSPDKGNR